MDFLKMAGITVPENLQVSLSYDELQEAIVKRSNEETGTLTGYECKLCLNRGYIDYYNGDHIISKQCKCIVQRKVMQNLKKSGLEDVIKENTFKTFEAHEEWQILIKNSAMEFVKENSKWFYIGGQSGSGKTHICTAMCGDFLKQGKNVQYMIWVTEIRNLKSVVNDDLEYTKLFNRFAHADVLYIDDLFKAKSIENISASDIQRTYELINYRAMSKKITIISSELTIYQLIDVDVATGGRIKALSDKYTFSINKSDDKNWRLK